MADNEWANRDNRRKIGEYIEEAMTETPIGTPYEDDKRRHEMEELEAEIMDWVQGNSELNFQASPTKAIEAVIKEAVKRTMYAMERGLI